MQKTRYRKLAKNLECNCGKKGIVLIWQYIQKSDINSPQAVEILPASEPKE